MSKKSISLGISTSLLILFCALAYFVYGGLAGVFAIAILCVLLSIASLLGLFPIAGVIVFWYVATQRIFPFVFDLTKIIPTWLTDIIFALYLIVSIIYTIVMLFVVFIEKKHRRRRSRFS